MSEKPPSPPENTADTAQAVAKIDALIEGSKKKTELDWSNIVGYGLPTGVTAWLGVGPTVEAAKGGILRKQLDNPEFRKTYDAAATAVEKEAVVTKMLDETAERIGGIGRSFMKNANGWKIGMTAVSVGAVLGWELWRQMERKAESKKEIADLNDLKKSWVERTAESGKDEGHAHIKS